ncbi:MAG TPA: NAD(P)/FAD-dependent oxidoreductase [Pyrinomonadaceae bacterium]
MSSNELDIIIVGAGVAGLAAACELAREGARVYLVEARERVGGRVYTQHDKSSPVPIELGAEFMHGKPSQLMDLIEAANLPFCDAVERHWYLESGRLSKSADFWHKLNQLMDQMKIAEPDRSFAEFLDSFPNDAETAQAKALAERYVQGFHAARTERIGVHGLIKANEAEEEVEGHKSFRILSGYSSVADFLLDEAQQHDLRLHLNTVVQEIRWSRHQVYVVCTNDEQVFTLKAAAVVVTLPLGVLQAGLDQPGAVRFAPELPAKKAKAIRDLEMGDVIKLNLRFQNRFWEDVKLPGTEESLEDLGFLHSPEAPLPTWWTALPVRAPLIVGWVGGPDAELLLQRGEELVVSQGIASLSRIFRISESSLENTLEEVYLHNWASDSYARGSYSYIPVNGLASQLELAAPVDDTLFFAGEATCLGHIGTVHGALMSGKRAAREVLEREIH